jgi:putative pyruvate formate lyase activating enzyme
MIALVKAVRREGARPVVVYNTNGYDRVETLRELEGLVDIYLPDFKYTDTKLAQSISGAADYPEVAARALAEMYRQKGNLLHLDENGMAERGLIVRHLVLPGHVDNSLQALRFLAENLSPRITLSLMSQYQPIAAVSHLPPFNRPLLNHEYDMVVQEMERLGFTDGWIQDSSSAQYYNPNFEHDTPFRL